MFGPEPAEEIETALSTAAVKAIIKVANGFCLYDICIPPYQIAKDQKTVAL